MSIKKGVSLLGLQPQMVIAFVIAKDILAKYHQEAVITSGSDGKHSAKSRHKVGVAIDLRSRDIASDAEKIKCVAEIRAALGETYYVLLEASHIHIQWNGI